MNGAAGGQDAQRPAEELKEAPPAQPKKSSNKLLPVEKAPVAGAQQQQKMIIEEERPKMGGAIFSSKAVKIQSKVSAKQPDKDGGNNSQRKESHRSDRDKPVKINSIKSNRSNRENNNRNSQSVSKNASDRLAGVKNSGRGSHASYRSGTGKPIKGNSAAGDDGHDFKEEGKGVTCNLSCTGETSCTIF